MAAEKVGEFREGGGGGRAPAGRGGGGRPLPFSIRHKSLANNTSKAGRSLRGEGRFESRN
jgi:hypothetical protein